MIADDRLDVERLMSAPNGEVGCGGTKLLVVAQRHGDPVGAHGVPALADDLELWQDVAEALRDTLQTLVDVAEEDLVLDDAFLVLFDDAPRRRAARGASPRNKSVAQSETKAKARRRVWFLHPAHVFAAPRSFRAPGRVNLMGDHTDYNEGLGRGGLAG